MRALWPPLRDIPLSPTSVLSPCGNSSRSLFRAQTCITSLYLSALYGCPNKMFCLTVPTNSHGSCEQYATSPPTTTDPFDSGNSPSTVCSNELYKAIKVCIWLANVLSLKYTVRGAEILMCQKNAFSGKDILWKITRIFNFQHLPSSIQNNSLYYSWRVHQIKELLKTLMNLKRYT